jgi:hypothetical protein
MESILSHESLPVMAGIGEEQVCEALRLMQGGWAEQCQAVVFVRCCVKSHPAAAPELLYRFAQPLYEVLNGGKPLAIKNCIALLGESFLLGRQLDLARAVEAFLVLLLKKWASEIGSMKELIHQCLQVFAAHCGYECSFSIVSQMTVDKNPALAEYAIRLLAKLMGTLGPNVTKLSAETLHAIMRAMAFLMDGKKQNMKNFAKQVAGFIYAQVGPEAFLNMLNFVLSPEETQLVIRAMQETKSKAKDVLPLASALKIHRQSKLQPYPAPSGHYNGNA